jgi:ATP-binding cassette subfamily B protein/ATP-binding cassette subfamily C protein
MNHNKNRRTLKEDGKVVLHFLKLVHKIQKGYLPLVFISACFQAATPFFGIIIPKYIIEELMGKQRFHYFLLYIGILIIGNGSLSLINKILTTRVQLANTRLINGFEVNLGYHIMDMNFENLEDPKVLDMKEQATFPITNFNTLPRMVELILTMVRITITILGLTAIIATLNPLIIVFILLVVLINGLISKKAQHIRFDVNKKLIPLNRKFDYYNDLILDFSMAKDIRLYNMAPYIGKKIEDYNNEVMKYMTKSLTTAAKYVGINSVTLPLEMMAIYGYMIYQVLGGIITIGDFTMYIAAGNSFTSSITEFIGSFVELRNICLYLDAYLEFEQFAFDTKENKDGDSVSGAFGGGIIEFKHVYFRYPRSEEYTLKDVNLTIHPGEKLSVVGQNGAGKTTFIKLLCRLYKPESGEILFDGVNINEYSFAEYMKLLSVVFQDFKLFSLTLKENIAFDKAEETGDSEIMEVLEKVGLKDRITALKNGLSTSIFKNFDKNGIELSGGQAQKLAIARAIFKNAPLIILDEPTAALDPFAEYEIYISFNKLIGEGTAIYISHRLSSCKFCDKIAVFDGGRLTEYGTHQDLVNNDGMYAKMWAAQAQYYA